MLEILNTTKTSLGTNLPLLDKKNKIYQILKTHNGNKSNMSQEPIRQVKRLTRSKRKMKTQGYQEPSLVLTTNMIKYTL